MSLENFKNAMMTLIIIALIIGAFALGLDAFQSDLGSDNACAAEDATFDTTTRTCSGSATSNATSTAFNTSQEGLEGIANATSYLSTIGTLIGVAALIAIVVGAFMFIRK